MTFTFSEQAEGITQREGQFDDNNWLFLEDNWLKYRVVRRTSTSWSPVDVAVDQENRNIDTMDWNWLSKITLDFTKTQILYIDYEWLWVGRVRMWFVIDWNIYYVHEFLNTNVLDTVYMSHPNLPLRSEITNDWNGPASSMTQICSTVIVEWWQNDNWVIRHASTEWTHLDANVENTVYALLWIRLKANYIWNTVNILNTALQIQTASHKCEWLLLFNPTVAWTFTYADVTRSWIQVAKWVTANTVTWWYVINGWFIESWGASSWWAWSSKKAIENALRLWSKIDWTVDEIVLCVRPIWWSSNVDVEGSITWREIL